MESRSTLLTAMSRSTLLATLSRSIPLTALSLSKGLSKGGSGFAPRALQDAPSRRVFPL